MPNTGGDGFFGGRGHGFNLGRGTPLPAMLDRFFGAAIQPADEAEARPGADKFLGIDLLALAIEGFGVNVSAEEQIRQRQHKHAGNRLIAADIRMVPQTTHKPRQKSAPWVG